MTPAVSVVMPNFNGRAWLAEAVESVLAQSFADFELVVVDDGSTDGSPEVLQAFAARDRRVRPILLPHVGLAAARNRALAETRAPLMACLDSDDIALPHRLQRQVDFLAEHPQIGAAAAWSQGIDAKGRPLGPPNTPTLAPAQMQAAFERANPVTHSTVIARTALLRELGGYRAPFVPAEDYDLWLRVVEVSAMAIQPEVLIQGRVHSGSLSQRSALRQAFSARLARSSAAARRTTGADPFEGLETQPDWTVPPPPGAPYARDLALYRGLDGTALDPAADPQAGRAWDQAGCEALREQIANLNHTERRRAALSLAARLSDPDRPRARAARALLIDLLRAHPRTVLRAAWSLRE